MISINKLKHLIREISKNEKIPHEVLYQNFFFERFLERLSISNKYREKFILKGGYMISSIVGISERTTNDIDMTVETLKLSIESLTPVIDDICSVDLDDQVKFTITNISDIRLEDKYNGLRYTILCELSTIRYHIKLDFSTGDLITPKQEERTFKLHFSNKSISLLAYSIETILAEKLETILSRNVANTRGKDFYDVYILFISYSDMFNEEVLREAVYKTIENRETQTMIQD